MAMKLAVRDGSRYLLLVLVGMLMPLTVIRPIMAGLTGWWCVHEPSRAQTPCRRARASRHWHAPSSPCARSGSYSESLCCGTRMHSPAQRGGIERRRAA